MAAAILSTKLMAVIGGIIALGLLILVHEWGHYWVARKCGMRVDRFSVGFGPSKLGWSKRTVHSRRTVSGVQAVCAALLEMSRAEPFSHVGIRFGKANPVPLSPKQILAASEDELTREVSTLLGSATDTEVEVLAWDQTDFALAPIPFGGYVQISGMILEDEVEMEDSRAFPNRPLWQRAATIFAGPATNYVFAVVLAIGLYNAAGVSTGTSWFQVGQVTEGYDAVGKLEPGDLLTKLNGQPIYFTFEKKPHTELAEKVNESKNTPIELEVLRDGKAVTVTVTPKETVLGNGKSVYRLGIVYALKSERVDMNVAAATGHALIYPVDKTKEILRGLWKIITAKEKAHLAGPVGIATMMKRTFEVGWIPALELLMMLNVYLGLFNLLPLPALDGGRLVFLGYEMATRRRAPPRLEQTIHAVGLMALFVVLILATYQDIARLFQG